MCYKIIMSFKMEFINCYLFQMSIFLKVDFFFSLNSAEL